MRYVWKRERSTAYADWPKEDQRLWQNTFEQRDPFDERCAPRWSAATLGRARATYSSFLYFVATHRPGLVQLAPCARLNPDVAAEYVVFLRRTCRDRTVAGMLATLAYLLRAFGEGGDWSWLLQGSRRIGRQAIPMIHPHVTSERPYALGLDLMAQALAEADRGERVSLAQAIMYREGLMIALLAESPLRIGSLVKLCIGTHLVRCGDAWSLQVPAEDTKTGRALDYAISERLGGYLETYLERFRGCLPGADDHQGLWPSKSGGPLTAIGIYQSIARRTKAAFGFVVSPHRFRHAAATFWSERDPENVLGAKDLLGHTSFKMTEEHYIVAQSRIAGRMLTAALRRFYRGGRSSRVPGRDHPRPSL